MDLVSEDSTDLVFSSGANPAETSYFPWWAGGYPPADDLSRGEAYDGQPEEVIVLTAKVRG